MIHMKLKSKILIPLSEEEFLFEMNKTYEEFIKKDPSGYLWMHRRFKSGQVESLS